MDNPFGRQPEPVTVRITGDDRDVTYWLRELMRRAEFKGDMVQTIDGTGNRCAAFRIFPRAVND